MLELDLLCEIAWGEVSWVLVFDDVMFVSYRYYFIWFQVSVVSVVYSQSELLQKEVFLVELVDAVSKSSESMYHLKAVCFLRPTSENIQLLRRQLANPRFGEYHLCEFFMSFMDF